MRKFIIIYIILSILFAFFTIRQYIIEHIQLKYGANDFNLIGDDPYEIIRSKCYDMINYIYAIGGYIILSIIFGVYVLRRIKREKL